MDGQLLVFQERFDEFILQAFVLEPGKAFVGGQALAGVESLHEAQRKQWKHEADPQRGQSAQKHK